LTIYSLEFHVDALKEWRKLDASVQQQFKKQLAKRLVQPHVSTARLHSALQNTYKIKLRQLGYRLVYTVIDQKLIVFVIAVGKREQNAVYETAIKRR
jgi:mRNA interferase RelE/StbE